ncbi:hypothetical protein RJ639_013521 [Escallonia herrerae]|uniref:DNA-directed RNA polymerase subunit n=1 Tax=Escallonia herrerae TaxID=1293975 RepID=A0AA89AQY5_9ASTE|nr:hypothetical protein RJ639_013521 [Escallonia herrerae]
MALASIPARNLDKNGMVAPSLIVTCLLKHMLHWKAMERYGYFLAVTKLKSIGDGEFQELSRLVLFPVAFNCRTFLPVDGEVMLGVVYKIRRPGAFLKCGPMNFIYLSAQKMPDYHYVDGEKPHFLDDNLSRIEDGVVIRFVVFCKRWGNKVRDIGREFMVLASLEGDSLGPMSLPGTDGLEL